MLHLFWGKPTCWLNPKIRCKTPYSTIIDLQVGAHAHARKCLRMCMDMHTHVACALKTMIIENSAHTLNMHTRPQHQDLGPQPHMRPNQAKLGWSHGRLEDTEPDGGLGSMLSVCTIFSIIMSLSDYHFLGANKKTPKSFCPRHFIAAERSSDCKKWLVQRALGSFLGTVRNANRPDPQNQLPDWVLKGGAPLLPIRTQSGSWF